MGRTLSRGGGRVLTKCRKRPAGGEFVPIVYCSLELYLPYCHSLKEKRNVLRKTCERVRSRFNFSIAQLGPDDSWQRGRLGAVSVGSDRRRLQHLAEDLIREAEKTLGSDLLRSDIEFFEND